MPGLQRLQRSVIEPRGALALLAAVLTVCLFAHVSRADNPKKTPDRPKSAAGPAVASTAPRFRSSDVLATVEGKPITRRELTYYWLRTDARTSTMIGSLLADRWKAAKGELPAYTVTEAEIYGKLFADKNVLYANVLSNLVTYRLAAVEAERKGILVTQTQAAAYA